MDKALRSSLSVILLTSLLMGCGSGPANESVTLKQTYTIAADKEQSSEDNAVRTINYLGQSYTIPAEPKRILFLSAFELMEDAVLMGYEPYAASAIGDEKEPFPGFFGKVTSKTIPLLSDSADSMEYVLELAPDLILSTDMETTAVLEKLNKVAITIPTSHHGPNWEKNLELLGEIIGEQQKAKQLIAAYKKDKIEIASRLSQLSDQNVVSIRVRGKEMMIYPEDLFLNDVLYGEIGLTVPDIIKGTKQQTVISLEGLYDADPDYIFVQFDLYENNMDEQVLKELTDSPIWKGLKAAREGRVFVNAVDPLIMGGGTAYGRMSILKAVEEKLS
ncbi:ABC transporter substrate-binding protein [Paenibacillus sp. L3-i20]|uniref:ABC transporter substrate-binding protein n=1 Tax=Paenibacillus sp. L3-i20 TaxID=2905833 RepID=UPI001EE1043B|nr:ABC transporter substrate-binding protein [Paenibacillus sp. L3-i20]GKU77993.1 iron-uptake system-binding protein [Paenibacillus sp. L3-i20]